MSQSLYDLEKIIARAGAWRREGDLAPLAEIRAFCLEEARRCDDIVRRSLETPSFVQGRGGVGQFERAGRC